MSPASATPWHLDDLGLFLAEGMVYGGDVQASDPWEVRFVRDDIPGALVTVYVYVSDKAMLNGDPDVGEHMHVALQTEFMICADPADPGSTEIWSDMAYAECEPEFSDMAAAEKEAAGIAGGIAESWRCTWDGEPQYSHAALRALAPAGN